MTLSSYGYLNSDISRLEGAIIILSGCIIITFCSGMNIIIINLQCRCFQF